MRAASSLGASSVSGPVNRPGARLSTDPLYLDVASARSGRASSCRCRADHNAFLYLYEGDARVGTGATTRALPHAAAAVLSDGDSVRIEAGADGARLLLLAARPLREPVVQYGPFVMNTRAEIEQAVDDYRSGRLGAAS